MSQIPINELNDRTRVIFRMVVESYLDSGAPVGSRTISKFPGLNLSPASIRNVMQDLEEAGLLAAPHTSAGRMPTDVGLRMFVDGMMQASEPSDDERAAIEGGIAYLKSAVGLDRCPWRLRCAVRRRSPPRPRSCRR